MAGKRSEIEAQIKALQEELAGADDDDDFEIEIASGDKKARLPYRHGKKWLADNFGIDVGAPAGLLDSITGGEGEGGEGEGGQGGGKPASTGSPAARTYFKGGKH